MKNDFCDSKDLGNESSVEHFFMSRLIVALGYSDSQVRTKESISEVVVSAGRKKVKYKPDYVLTLRRRPRIVIDAKATTENIDEWTGQCSSYCLEINKNYDDNPATIFILTNGLKTSVYDWSKSEPLMTLEFSDFKVSGGKFKRFVKL